jgi:DNA-binding transcriptional LysR family regulator
MTSYPRFQTRTIRREPLRLALSETDPLGRCEHVELAALSDRRFELWPRDMAPGFYDTVLGTCHAAGFEPELAEQAAGNTVWGNLARGRGVALINDSLIEQLPRGITLVELAKEQDWL